MAADSFIVCRVLCCPDAALTGKWDVWVYIISLIPSPHRPRTISLFLKIIHFHLRLSWAFAAVHGLLVAARRLSRDAASRVCSLGAVHGFSWCGAWTSGHAGSGVEA